MFRKVLLSSAVLTLMSAAPALAQISTVREAVPAQSTAIMANSPQDIALQEEIRKIRAYNAYVDSQVGISDGGVAVVTSAPVSPYVGRKIELFETQSPSTQITYATTNGRMVSVTPAITTVTRQPITIVNSTHRIAEGDTLYSLARANCIAVKDIQNQNGMSGNNIRLGQIINITSQCGAVTTQAKVATAYVRKVTPVPTSIKVRANNYAVLPKDSLYSIGRRYCVSAGELATFNGIDTKTAIQPGQILRLPAGSCQK